MSKTSIKAVKIMKKISFVILILIFSFVTCSDMIEKVGNPDTPKWDEGKWDEQRWGN